MANWALAKTLDFLTKGVVDEKALEYADEVFYAKHEDAVTTEFDVAEAVWRAANDVAGQLRFPAGTDAVALTQSR